MGNDLTASIWLRTREKGWDEGKGMGENEGVLVVAYGMEASSLRR